MENVSRDGYTPSPLANNSNRRDYKARTTPSNRKPSTAKPKIEREHLFWQVIRAYREQSQLLASRRPTGRRKRCAAAEFVKHVESATRCALQGTGLFDSWQRLVSDDMWQTTRLMRQIVGRCAREYLDRGLAPYCFAPSDRRAPRSALRTPTRALCKQHGVRAVTHVFLNHDGKILRLDCGCDRREGIEAAVPVRGCALIMAAVPAAASDPISDSASVPEEIGTAA